MKNLVYILLVVLSLVGTMNAYFLHHCSEEKKTLEIKYNNLKLELYQELDSIAWNEKVTSNRRYVLGITRYYECNAVKEKIESYLNENQ